MTVISGQRDAIQPKHYALPNGKEVIDVIELATRQLKGVAAYDIGNTIKYLMRAGKKASDQSKSQSLADKEKEDLKKANWYCSHAIDNLSEFDCMINDDPMLKEFALQCFDDCSKKSILSLLLTQVDNKESKKTLLKNAQTLLSKLY